MKPQMVGLHGLTRTGKDTLADLLVARQGFTKLAFADPLYEEVANAFSVSVANLKSDVWKSNPRFALEIRRSADPAFVSHMRSLALFIDEPLSSRQILQLWGTEYRRQLFGEGYWVEKMIGRLRELGGHSDVVLSDVREPIESAMGHWAVSRGLFGSFYLIDVHRPGAVRTAHSSDRGLSPFLLDATLHNTGTPEELYDNAVHLMTGTQKERVDG